MKENGEIHCIVSALWIRTSGQSTTGLRVIGRCEREWHVRSFTVQSVHARRKEPTRAILPKGIDMAFQNWVNVQTSIINWGITNTGRELL
jgi:hypothetical protein